MHKKAALVTAGARRVGKALALRLASKSYDIALHFNSSEQEAEKCAHEVRALGVECRLFKADFGKNEELESLLSHVMEAMPGLSLLVNNASVWQPSRFLDSSLAELELNLRVHLSAPYVLSRDFARLARKGCIVNIIDSNISRHKSDYFPYILSKKALYDLTMLSAAELAPDIRVNAIAPGAVLAPEGENFQALDLKLSKNPLQRRGSPEDVADALIYLLSGEHISGQCIFVSAGKQLLT